MSTAGGPPSTSTLGVCRICLQRNRPGPTDDPERPATVCWACVLRLGVAVQHPELIDHAELVMLGEEHRDVVEIARKPGGPKDAIAFEWRWIGEV